MKCTVYTLVKGDKLVEAGVEVSATECYKLQGVWEDGVSKPVTTVYIDGHEQPKEVHARLVRLLPHTPPGTVPEYWQRKTEKAAKASQTPYKGRKRK